MCTTCVDLTDRISTVRKESWSIIDYWPNENTAAQMMNLTKHFLPNGQSIMNVDVPGPKEIGPFELTVKITARPSESIAFKSTATLSQAVSILRANFSGKYSQNWTSVPVTASECALYFCINAYGSEIKNGTLMEQHRETPSVRNPASFQILDENDTTLYRPNATIDALYEPKIWFNRSDLQIIFPQQVLANKITKANISQAAIDGISEYITGLFVIDGGVHFNEFGCTGAALAAGSPKNAGTESYAPASMQALAGTSSIDMIFSNLAASISANMRGTSDHQLTFSGLGGIYETFIQVHWAWIALPRVCVCLGTIFLILVIWQTSRFSLPIWKSSIFAVLTHGLDDSMMGSMKYETLNSQIEKSTKGMAVTLGGNLNLELVNSVAMCSGTDHQDGGADPSPRISVHTRHSSLFASQEIQALTTTEPPHLDNA